MHLHVQETDCTQEQVRTFYIAAVHKPCAFIQYLNLLVSCGCWYSSLSLGHVLYNWDEMRFINHYKANSVTKTLRERAYINGGVYMHFFRLFPSTYVHICEWWSCVRVCVRVKWGIVSGCNGGLDRSWADGRPLAVMSALGITMHLSESLLRGWAISLYGQLAGSMPQTCTLHTHTHVHTHSPPSLSTKTLRNHTMAWGRI